MKFRERSIVKHFRILPEYVKLAVKRESEYKLGFYTFIFHQLVTAAIWLLFWKVLINKIGDFGSWNYGRMVLLTGFVTINMGMWLTFVFIWRLPRQILTGELNSHLIKPVHPFLHMILQHLNLRSLPRILIGVLILIYALSHFELQYSRWSLVVAGVTSFLSFLTSFMPFATICLLAFWIGRAEFIRDLFIELFVFQNYPLTEFPTVFIAVFTVVIPLIFSATVPVLVLTKLSLGWGMLLLAGLIIIISLQLWLFGFLWNRGLRRYESYGG
ncbi:MAG: ABC-2 family transporter protein [Sedimentisphaerales bacterium]|nr:ABC-2 family transporter protein [Sedimentisphaerales bacterium]